MMYTYLFVLIFFVQINNISCNVAFENLAPIGIPQSCGENEIIGCWNECEAQCPTFYNLNAPKPHKCSDCMQGCICRPGYIRNSANGACIGKDHCPIPDDACLTHEMFSVCGAACQLTCMEPHPAQNCGTCMPGYVCIPGYVRNPITGLCVTFNECPQSLLNCAPSSLHTVVNQGQQIKPIINMLRKSPKKKDPK